MEACSEAVLFGLVNGPTVPLPRGAVPVLEPLSIVVFGSGYSGDTVADDGDPFVNPVPDMGAVSLEPGEVPVGPVTAVELANGYGAVPEASVDDSDALCDGVSSADEGLPLPNGTTVPFGAFVTDTADIVPEPATPLVPVAVELDRG